MPDCRFCARLSLAVQLRVNGRAACSFAATRREAARVQGRQVVKPRECKGIVDQHRCGRLPPQCRWVPTNDGCRVSSWNRTRGGRTHVSCDPAAEKWSTAMRPFDVYSAPCPWNAAPPASSHACGRKAGCGVETLLLHAFQDNHTASRSGSQSSGGAGGLAEPKQSNNTGSRCDLPFGGASGAWRFSAETTDQGRCEKPKALGGDCTVQEDPAAFGRDSAVETFHTVVRLQHDPRGPNMLPGAVRGQQPHRLGLGCRRPVRSNVQVVEPACKSSFVACASPRM